MFKLLRPALLFFLAFNLYASEFVYSLKLGESFDSIRGKLDLNWSTTDQLGWTIVNTDNIPGGSRYISSTDLVFYKEEFVGVIFLINPRISDFDSYEDRNKFMMSTFSTLANKFDKKYRSNYQESSNFVQCPNSKTYDYSTCIGFKAFYSKHKAITLNYTNGSIYQTVASKKHFKNTNELLTGVLKSQYMSHLEGLIEDENVKKRQLEKMGVKFETKAFNLESAELEVLYSEIP
mgnify:FL=1